MEKDPKTASKLKMTAVMPVQQSVSSFASPSRTQLQNYENKEQYAKPTSTYYRP